MDINNLERKTKAELFELIKSKQTEIDAVKKIKVVHGGDFRDRWEGVYITEDQFNYCYETSDSEHVAEQLLFNEFECHGFGFDSNIHEEI